MSEIMKMTLSDRRRLPIAVLSFDRPEYLAKTLISLRSQLIEGDTVYLFQDGAFNSFSQRTKSDSSLIRQCVQIFREIIPIGVCFESPFNLGIAGNYRRAEEFLFGAMQKDYALFLEDDLLLSPNYLSITSKLLSIALEHNNIGYVSACGDLWSDLEKQKILESQLIPMHENWGAAMTKQSWIRQKVVREKYWTFVKDVDYSLRPNDQIIEWYSGMGYNMPITSQDGSRWVACVEAGMSRVTTATCNSLYIGEVGEHFRREHYQACRLSESQMYPCDHEIFTPTDDFLTSLVSSEKALLVQGYTHSYANMSIVADKFQKDTVLEGQSLYISTIEKDAIFYLWKTVSEDLRKCRLKHEQELNDMSNSLVSCQLYIKKLSAELASATSLAAEERILRNNLAVRNAELEANLMELKRKCGDAEIKLVELIQWSMEFHNSTSMCLSWRITKPLRWLGIGRPERPPLPRNFLN